MINRFDPQALTSLTSVAGPNYLSAGCFDPQALTSLTQTAHFYKQLP